jgi:FAD/FMN-containing dehydrogenase
MESSSTTEAVPIRGLRSAVQGQVLTPEDEGYEAGRRLFYTGFNARPAAIVQVASAEDVARVVLLAAEAGVELAVRSGGHSFAGHSVCAGGIVLDLSRLDGMEIDDRGRSAWAGSGLTAGAYTAVAGAHGLATGFGDAPTVGIGGITLGGGVGFLHRRYGLTIDSLRAAEIVTADGRIIMTDPESHADLFWAIRGGGGNFGVATRFCFDLHEVDHVYGGMMILPATPAIVAACVAEAESAPDDLSGMFNVTIAPPMPFIPAEHHGTPVVMAMLVHSGDLEEGRQVFDRFRGLAPPIVDTAGPTRYRTMYEGHENVPRPAGMSIRTAFMDRVDEDAVAAALDGLRAGRAPMRVFQIRVLGGAVARVAPDATAFAHRDRPLMTSVAAIHLQAGEAAEHDAWAEDLMARLPIETPGGYVGFMADGGIEGARAAYPEPVWQRLRQVKKQYDPGNLFRLNTNIPPA